MLVAYWTCISYVFFGICIVLASQMCPLVLEVSTWYACWSRQILFINVHFQSICVLPGKLVIVGHLDLFTAFNFLIYCLKSYRWVPFKHLKPNLCFVPHHKRDHCLDLVTNLWLFSESLPILPIYNQIFWFILISTFCLLNID